MNYEDILDMFGESCETESFLLKGIHNLYEKKEKFLLCGLLMNIANLFKKGKG